MRPIGHRAQRMRGALYEYQWKFASACRRPVRGGTRVTSRRRMRWLRSCSRQARPCASGSIGCGFRTNSNRSRGRPRPPTSCAPCVNWAGRQRRTRRCRSRQLADRLGMAPQYHRWLRLMLKELTADEIASTRGAAPPVEGVVGRVPGMSGRIDAAAAVRREPAGGAPGRDRSAEPHLPGRCADHRGEPLSGFTDLPAQQSAGAESARRDRATICRKEGRCEFWRSAAEPAG